jgi:hypothetical protein
MPESKYEWLIARREVQWRNSKFFTSAATGAKFPCKKAAATLLCGIPRWSRFLFAVVIKKKIKTVTKEKHSTIENKDRSHPGQRKMGQK